MAGAGKRGHASAFGNIVDADNGVKIGADKRSCKGQSRGEMAAAVKRGHGSASGNIAEALKGHSAANTCTDNKPSSQSKSEISAAVKRGHSSACGNTADADKGLLAVKINTDDKSSKGKSKGEMGTAGKGGHESAFRSTAEAGKCPAASTCNRSWKTATGSFKCGGDWLVGRRIRVFYEKDSCWYSGFVTGFQSENVKDSHGNMGPAHDINYDDGAFLENLTTAQWQYDANEGAPGEFWEDAGDEPECPLPSPSPPSEEKLEKPLCSPKNGEICLYIQSGDFLLAKEATHTTGEAVVRTRSKEKLLYFFGSHKVPKPNGPMRGKLLAALREMKESLISERPFSKNALQQEHKRKLDQLVRDVEQTADKKLGVEPKASRTPSAAEATSPSTKTDKNARKTDSPSTFHDSNWRSKKIKLRGFSDDDSGPRKSVIVGDNNEFANNGAVADSSFASESRTCSSRKKQQQGLGKLSSALAQAAKGGEAFVDEKWTSEAFGWDDGDGSEDEFEAAHCDVSALR